jgi:hypothetical protein
MTLRWDQFFSIAKLTILQSSNLTKHYLDNDANTVGDILNLNQPDPKKLTESHNVNSKRN